MVILIMLSVVVWLAIPPMLSRAMVRRGYDGESYLIVGALFGPVAVLFAVLDVLFDVQEPPRILEQGHVGHGDLSVLVVVGGGPTPSPPPTALVALEPRLRRLSLAQVLPKGGPREDKRRAERDLRQAATGLGHPELVLLFGRPDVTISDYAVAGGYDLVFTSCPDRLLTGRLKGSRRVHWWGDEARVFGPGRLSTTGWRFGGTEALAPSSAVWPRPARTA